MHHAALQFDIGIYFEANGHGTVLFSDACLQELAKTSDGFLSILPTLINPAVGDAISDLLLVDLLLRQLGWNLEDWNTQFFTDLPSRQLKVKVADRSIIKCNDNETQCVAPASMQPALDEAMKSVPQGRCFVRPSGTEDVVRVYAEAATRQDADRLATETAKLVHEHCGGVGPLSSI